MCAQTSPDVPKEVEDPGELNQREQIRQINSARADVRDIRNRVAEHSVTGDLSTQRSNTAYREVITSYALLLAPYLRSDTFGDDELWEGEDDDPLAAVQIPAPAPEDLDGDIEQVEPSKYVMQINGIKDLLQTPAPIQVEFEAHREHELRGKEQVTVNHTAEISRQTLDEIVITLDEYRIGVGLGLKLPDVVEDRSHEPF